MIAHTAGKVQKDWEFGVMRCLTYLTSEELPINILPVINIKNIYG